MAKKYLLYIHIDAFDNEPHKSQLVNMLLRRHYEPAKARAVLIHDNPPPIIKAPPRAPEREQVCKKHGLPVLLGRTTCGMKGCA